VNHASSVCTAPAPRTWQMEAGGHHQRWRGACPMGGHPTNHQLQRLTQARQPPSENYLSGGTRPRRVAVRRLRRKLAKETGRRSPPAAEGDGQSLQHGSQDQPGWHPLARACRLLATAGPALPTPDGTGVMATATEGLPRPASDSVLAEQRIGVRDEQRAQPLHRISTGA
jgi:hypothetical protein